MADTETGTEVKTRPTEDEVREVLRTVEDPELRMSILELGLIYGVEVDEQEGLVSVDMTLTSPACHRTSSPSTSSIPSATRASPTPASCSTPGSRSSVGRSTARATPATSSSAAPCPT